MKDSSSTGGLITSQRVLEHVTPLRRHGPMVSRERISPRRASEIPPVPSVLSVIDHPAPGRAAFRRERHLSSGVCDGSLSRMVDAAKIARRMEAELKETGTPERATGEKSYLKSDLTFFGTPLADIRRVAKATASDEQLTHDDLIGLVRELWRKPVFERRIVAVVLLGLGVHRLGPTDLALIERLIRESKTWALVDGLAGDVVGEIGLRHRIKQKLDRWAKDEDFWVRRSSLLAELKPLKMGSPFPPFAARADAMLDDTEFFIRKAIGWVLRETSKKRPWEVYEWIAPRTHRASGVTMREAVKYLDEREATRLMRAYKEGRPAI